MANHRLWNSILAKKYLKLLLLNIVFFATLIALTYIYKNGLIVPLVVMFLLPILSIIYGIYSYCSLRQIITPLALLGVCMYSVIWYMTANDINRFFTKWPTLNWMVFHVRFKLDTCFVCLALCVISALITKLTIKVIETRKANATDKTDR